MHTNKVNEIEVIEKIDGLCWGLKAINAPHAWEKTKGEGVKIAVIDTGVDSNHDELKGKIKLGINMQNKTNNIEDDYGHGTHIAGLLVGKNVGVAPEAELYVAKVLDSKGLGSMANIIDGITFAINTNVDVLCMSLGVDRKLPQILEERLKKAYDKGITIVCATGNSGVKPPEYPAFYDYVIAVGGADETKSLASFSNFGTQMDLIAPSVDITSSYLDNKYAKMTGTSMASPLVAGAIALIKSYHKGISNEEIFSMLSKLSDSKTKTKGYGFLDLSKLFND